jgi:uncharacterized Zn finger protein
MEKIDCPDCGKEMVLKTHAMLTEEYDGVELDFPTCKNCGHVMYSTNYE